MNRTEKEALVAELKTKLESATALYYTDFTGLNVKRMTDLRRRLRKANVEYVVIKNTLALRAVNESGLVGERLKGPTGLVVASMAGARRRRAVPPSVAVPAGGGGLAREPSACGRHRVPPSLCPGPHPG